MRFSTRGDAEICVLSFYQAVFGEDNRPEIVRVAMSRKHAQSMVDIMTKLLDHYPKRAEGSEA